MKIPIPERGAKAIKQFVLQILNTSLAVIIALSFQELVEWRRIRGLVATARAHMDSEVRDNGKDLAGVMTNIGIVQGDVDDRLAFIDEVLAARETNGEVKDRPGLFRTFNVVLSATSRSTAEATGALGHMDYLQVKRYAEAYSMQQEFNRIRERLAEQFTLVKPSLNEHTSLVKMSTPELQLLRGNLSILRHLLVDLRDYGTLLQGFYRQALTGR
jgi:hypothetical protein